MRRWEANRERRATEAQVRDDMAAEKRNGGPATPKQIGFVKSLLRQLGCDPDGMITAAHVEVGLPKKYQDVTTVESWIGFIGKRGVGALITSLQEQVKGKANG